MTAKEITDQLERIATVEDFALHSAELTDGWVSAGAGVETVEPVLRFMEEHPSIEYGMPGSLVHFVERFYGKGYEDKLVESIRRKPTSSTVWMLNRVINGTKVADAKQLLVATLEQAMVNPLADQNTVQRVSRFLERLSK